MYLVNIVQLDNYHYRRFNAPGSILRFPRYLRPPRQILRPIHPAQHHPPNQRIEPTGMGSTDLLVLGPHGREWQREGGSVCESFCRRSGGSCLWEIQAACIRTKQRDLALAHWQQEWPTGVHGRTAHKIMPAPTKDIFAVHERLRRAASAVLIQMQTGRIAPRDYAATIQQWREEQLDFNPLRQLRTCSCEQECKSCWMN